MRLFGAATQAPEFAEAPKETQDPRHDTSKGWKNTPVRPARDGSQLQVLLPCTRLSELAYICTMQGHAQSKSEFHRRDETSH
jgi:hypothetical protein